MNICIASGKGGTGKTTVAVNLAFTYARRNKSVHLMDADVDAANAHLFVETQDRSESISFVKKPEINTEICTGCGACMKNCQYHAITVLRGTPLVFEELCHACGVCAEVCPVNAIGYKKERIGRFFRSERSEATPFSLSWGELDIGQVQAPDMIRQLKDELNDSYVNIMDASPGAGCPVRETMANSAAVVLVTEPTLFGLNDLRMAAELALKMSIPAGIIVNRSREDEDIISEFSRETGIPILGRIPFSRDYAHSYSKGDILVDLYPEFAQNCLKISHAVDALANSRAVAPFMKMADNSAAGRYKNSENGKPQGVKEWVVMSGKGGTGKTTLSASLAMLMDNATYFDADVDASNLPIILKGNLENTRGFSGGYKAEINPEKCIGCGLCAEKCHFNAIEADEDKFKVIPEACEGCGMCHLVCPHGAVSFQEAITGYVYHTDTEKGQLSHAFLNIGEENSGKLVTQVRDQAYVLSELHHSEHILGDGPPGTGCPVIASATGADLAIIVTEPSLSGIHDLIRALKLVAHFQLKPAVIINKCDMNDEQTKAIHNLCMKDKIHILGQIPFDDMVNRAVMEQRAIIDYPNSDAALAIRNIWKEIRENYI